MGAADQIVTIEWDIAPPHLMLHAVYLGNKNNVHWYFANIIGKRGS